MCGLFGFAGANPDRRLLAAVAVAAGGRGPHGHGWSYVVDESFVTARRRGRLDASNAAAVVRYPGGDLVGHARLSTTGDLADVAAYQPLTRGAVALAHNGVVRDAPERARRGGVDLRTTCDSEALAALTAARWSVLGLQGALAAVLDDLDDDAPHALLSLSVDGQYVAAVRASRHQRRHPLWALRRPEGTYLSSRRTDDPDWSEMPVGCHEVGR